MHAEHTPYVESWYGHICALAGEIGPRGATTVNERRASEYCRDVLTRLGFEPQVESFTSATSSFQIHTLVALAMLLAFIVYPLAGRISAGLATLLAFLAVYSETMEMLFRNNPLRRLIAKGCSQNVIAALPPADEHRQDLILMGHVDTNRAPLIFSSQRRVIVWRAFATLTFFTFCLQTILYAAGTILQVGWGWSAGIPGALCATLLAAACIQADLSPYSPGANDNASGSGLVLALAGHLRAEPLKHTRVWLACTGCEEVKHYGAIDFYRRHLPELHHPAALVFEMMGIDDLAWAVQEGVIVPFVTQAGADLITLSQQVAAGRPDLRAGPAVIMGGGTEMADAIRFGVPAITLIGTGPHGTGNRAQARELYWHQIGDTVDKIDPTVLQRAYTFTWELIQALDAGAGA